MSYKSDLYPTFSAVEGVSMGVWDNIIYKSTGYNIKYIPRIMEICSNFTSCVYIYFTHIFQVTSQALGQSYDCPSTWEETLI